MKKSLLILSSLFLVLLCASAALAQASQFRFERQVVPGASGPNRIAPDVSLLSEATYSDLRDLRFFDAAGREVPYLLIPPQQPAPRWTPGTILPVAASKFRSGFEVDLGSSVLIDRLLLSGIPTPFLKRFRLEGGGDRSHWTLLVDDGTLFDLPEEQLRLIEAGFTAGEFRYLRVTWDDRRSAVVPQPRSVSARLVGNRAPAPPLLVPAEFKRLTAGPGKSRFQVRLPGPHLPLAALKLTVAEDRLLRTAQVTESVLKGGEVIPQVLGTTTLRRVTREEAIAEDLRIPIRAVEGREVEILVDDDNNPPLNLTRVDLEFEPQPWIYLESSDGKPIVARYGDANLKSPRYDLEAVRQYVEKKATQPANWRESRDLQPLTSAADNGLQSIGGASIDPKPFRYSRAIPASPPGLTALLLDVAVLAHSRPDLSDLRIVDGGNRQIPYLLEPRQDVLAVNLTIAPVKSSSAGQSRYEIKLPFENLPHAKLVLTTGERVFQRNIAVEVKPQAGDLRSNALAETVASAKWLHNDPDTPTPPLTLDLRSDLGTSVTLVVDEGDNRPLVVSAARLELPLYRLRFFYPSDAKLTLLYGQENLSAPRYDLQLLAPRLVGVSSRELALDPENATPAVNHRDISARVFWGALIVAVIVILLVLVRLLRSETVGHTA